MNISELIERYFEGETSLAEEQMLKKYFASGEIAEEHMSYADLFAFFGSEAKITFNGKDSIDLLLEKYFEGESEVEEEQRLKSYFASEKIEDRHQEYKDLFTYFAVEAEITYEGEDGIDLLLEKYFAGESDIAEEQRLKIYFNGEDVAEEHKEYKDLFAYFSIAQSEELEKNIDLKKGRTLHIVRRTMMGIAAGLALLLGSLYVMNTYQDYQQEQVIAEAEAEEALETTMEALAYLGIQFNKGTESLEQIKNLKKTEIFKD